jgi:peroxiredoxin
VRSDIVVGGVFPDYELPDHTRTPRRLSHLQGKHNTMILTLGRGAFCPKDRQHLAQLVAFSSQCGVGYTRLVTVTSEPWHDSANLRLAAGAHWPFLHDARGEVRDDLDLAEYTTGGTAMIPHTFVLEPGLRIHKIYNGYWYWGRPSLVDLHRDLRDITMNLRFDFDLGAPEVKGAWERGERHRFFPYDMSFEQTLSTMGVSGTANG